MNHGQLEEIANAIVAPGKGILAADESFPTIEKRFNSIELPSTEENRSSYREILFTTPGVHNFISGVILFDETIRQKTAQDMPFPQVLSNQGIISGIKVDTGAQPLANAPGEKITQGLDGLRERLREYRELGARFTKWRAVIRIGDGIPSQYCIDCNAHALARFASLSQEAGVVPIVEPEVLMDSNHTIDHCEEVTTATLHAVFTALYQQRVFLEGTLLKPNMVLSGRECNVQAGTEEIAKATTRCFLRTVPAALPGIVFLSGGQSAQQATQNLNTMNALGTFPWELSFSYGRALQAPVLGAWNGQAKNTEAAQTAFYHRAKCNSTARSGSYTDQLETVMA